MIRVEPLHLADFLGPDAHPRAGETVPVFGFLIRHPRGPVLVDTGVGPPHPAVDDAYHITRRPLTQALESVGVAIRDVRCVINTHLHFDHSGENPLFRGRPIYVQGAEYEAAHTADYTLPDRVRFPEAKYVLVSGDSEIVPGIRVLPSRGHTPGHQSVLVGGSNGVLLAGQAIETAEEFERGEPTDRNRMSAWDPASYARSFRELRALAPRRAYFSHDGAVWDHA